MNEKARPLSVWIVITAALTGCSGSAGGVYTLYRNSPLDPTMRIHVASFDSADGEKYNIENCQLTSDLFKAQPGVTARYWCEQGRFKP